MKERRTVYTLEDDGQQYTTAELAEKFNTTIHKVRHRINKRKGWRDDGVVTAEMITDDTGSKPRPTVFLNVIDDRAEENGGTGETWKMSLPEVARFCNKLLNSTRNVISYNSRWIRAKRPDTVKLSMFLTWESDYVAKKDRDLDHIQAGDLAHLSNKQKSQRHINKVLGKPGTWETKNLDPKGFAPDMDSFSGRSSSGNACYTGRY